MGLPAMNWQQQSLGRRKSIVPSDPHWMPLFLCLKAAISNQFPNQFVVDDCLQQENPMSLYRHHLPSLNRKGYSPKGPCRLHARRERSWMRGVTFLLSHTGEALASVVDEAPLNREGRNEFPIMVAAVQVI
ncbi:hypothetical protein EYC84_004908 [Monilinia fructicola]|uniref:Uncharacterized protein n=1 Tax=Monilinia fructicola TaxID=38448 RepID=A0A5M9K4S4_MONFR|nr:hypothetical protein EYC84_004908 [Monilinia fructicola]